MIAVKDTGCGVLEDQLENIARHGGSLAINLVDDPAAGENIVETTLRIPIGSEGAPSP
ncbi:MAG: hypothetical protein AAF493_03095 [Pseudomonadota bacterium]